MKKIYLLAMAATIGSAAFSQVNWGAQATGNLSTAKLSVEGAEFFKKTPSIGFGVGIVSDVTLNSQLSLRSSLNLLQKGGKLKSAFDELSGDGSFFPPISIENKFYYAELPVNLVYNVKLSNAKLFFGAGPSLGYGLFGKTNVTTTNPFDPTQKETDRYDAFKKEADGGAGYKRFDFSANAVAGIQLNSGFYVNAGYLLGLSNLADGEDDEAYKNRGLQLTVGFFLKKK